MSQTIRYEGRDMTVEVTGRDKVPYRLHGRRGACYSLFRNHNRPELLYAVSTSNMHVQETWLTDRDGILRECA